MLSTLATIVLALVAGFFVGNGLPYYVAGSTGEGINPSPFPDTPRVNVLAGCAAVAIGAVAWAFTDAASHPIAAYSSAGLGALVVGLIHAGNWRTNPWRKRASIAVPPRS
jgi:hypothetical protein